MGIEIHLNRFEIEPTSWCRATPVFFSPFMTLFTSYGCAHIMHPKLHELEPSEKFPQVQQP